MFQDNIENRKKKKKKRIKIEYNDELFYTPLST